MNTPEQAARQREVERLTALFTDAIMHASMPQVAPNLTRWVESQAKSCALAVVDEIVRKGVTP